MRTLLYYKGLGLFLTVCIAVPIGILLYVTVPGAKSLSEYRELKKEKKSLYQNIYVAEKSDVSVSSKTPDVLSDGKILEVMQSQSQYGNVYILGYTPFNLKLNQHMALSTVKIDATGSFADLVRMLYHIEKEIEECRVISAAFSSVSERRTGTTSLYLTIYVQQLNLLR